MSLKYAVVGTGAIGGFYGGKLANAGKEVHFLFHNDYSYVKSHGLKVDSVTGSFHLNSINAYCNASEMPVCDVVLVGLKTTNNAILKSILSHIIHKNTLVILIQNGLGLEDDLSSSFPGILIAGGLAFICSNKVGAGHITHLDYGKLNLGAYKQDSVSALEKVYKDLTESGIESQLFDDLNIARWQKLVWNVPFNGLTVALNTTTDRIMKNKNSRQLAYDMMIEVIEGANKCNVAVAKSYADKMMELTEEMTPYAPSMKLDFDNKRPLEVEYIYSRPIQTALKAGYNMKKVAMLEQQLRFIQDNY